MVLDTTETFQFIEETGLVRQHMMSSLMEISLMDNIVAIELFNPRNCESRRRQSEFETPEDASNYFDNLTILWNQHLRNMRPD